MGNPIVRPGESTNANQADRREAGIPTRLVISEVKPNPIGYAMREVVEHLGKVHLAQWLTLRRLMVRRPRSELIIAVQDTFFESFPDCKHSDHRSVLRRLKRRRAAHSRCCLRSHNCNRTGNRSWGEWVGLRLGEGFSRSNSDDRSHLVQDKG